MPHGTAEAVLLEGQEAQLVLQGGKTRSKTGWPGTDNDHVVTLGRPTPGQLAYGFDRLGSLLDRIANEPHATELAGNEDPWNVGLEIRRHMGNIDASTFRPENKCDRVVRAGGTAGAVTDAVGGLDQLGLSVDQ